VIDLKRLREEPAYREGILRKRCAPEIVDALLAADDLARSLRTRVEELRARQNAASKAIGQAPAEERPAKVAAAKELKTELDALEPELNEA
jgi:seryl-tRNA synthetase